MVQLQVLVDVNENCEKIHGGWIVLPVSQKKSGHAYFFFTKKSSSKKVERLLEYTRDFTV